MTNASTPPSPAPMEGGGAYNRSSHIQAAGLSPAVPLLQRAASVVSLSDASEAIVIADYGSSEGRNSLSPMAVAIGALRERVGPNRAISVVHTDLPSNDFSALFETLDNDPDSYLRDDRPHSLRRWGVRIINRFCHQTASRWDGLRGPCTG